MDLKEFIVSAVTDISSAVAEADKKIKAQGGMVNPGSHQTPLTDSSGRGAFVAPRTTLHFDVAVSATNAKSAEAGAKARIWVMEASLGADIETKNEAVSRLSFSIDVVLPHDPDQNTRLGLVARHQ